MAELVADIQERIEERARRVPLDRVLVSDEAKRWAETLRRRSVIELRAIRADPTALAALLSAANAQRARAASAAVRCLDGRDLDTLLGVLEAMAAWERADWRARPAEDALLVAVRQALVETSMAQLDVMQA